MKSQNRHNLFSELITAHQSQLYGYIFALVRNREDAADLFQSVCVVLWKKFDSFLNADAANNPHLAANADTEGNRGNLEDNHLDNDAFFPWARQTAIFEVRNFLRREKSRHHLTEELLEAFTECDFDRQSDATTSYMDALRSCKGKLPSVDTELLDCHYGKGLSVQQVADRIGRTRQSVGNSLLRIRKSLLDCIRLQLVKQEYPEEERR